MPDIAFNKHIGYISLPICPLITSTNLPGMIWKTGRQWGDHSVYCLSCEMHGRISTVGRNFVIWLKCFSNLYYLLQHVLQYPRNARILLSVLRLISLNIYPSSVWASLPLDISSRCLCHFLNENSILYFNR